VKVKKFLEKQGIAYDPASPDVVLKGKAKARMRTINDEGISPEAKKAKFTSGEKKTLSVTALKAVLEKIKAAGTNDECFLRMNCTIEDLSKSDVAALKHGVGFKASCIARLLRLLMVQRIFFAL